MPCRGLTDKREIEKNNLLFMSCQLEDDDELFNIPTSPTLAKQSPVRSQLLVVNSSKEAAKLLTQPKEQQLVENPDLVFE
jgi:hypothetical protein